MKWNDVADDDLAEANDATAAQSLHATTAAEPDYILCGAAHGGAKEKGENCNEEERLSTDEVTQAAIERDHSSCRQEVRGADPRIPRSSIFEIGRDGGEGRGDNCLVQGGQEDLVAENGDEWKNQWWLQLSLAGTRDSRIASIQGRRPRGCSLE